MKSYEELNARLEDRGVERAKAHRHPELANTTIREAFEAERPRPAPDRGPLDGFHAVLDDGLDAVEATCAEALASDDRFPRFRDGFHTARQSH